MSDITEALGTAAEGALFSRAIEPAGGGGGVGESPGLCLNCGAELVGPHCHQCGQKAHVHRTIRAFMHDVLHGALHFEGKIWKTLPMLALKPGQLTRRYIEGERAKFVSPMALFLFVVFLMFASFQVAGVTTPTELSNPIEISDAQVARAGIEGRAATARRRAPLRAELSSLPVGSLRRGEIERELAGLDRADASLSRAENLAMSDNGASDSASRQSGETGIGWIDHGLEKWRKQPALMLYKLQSNFYKFSWLLIPLSTPFLWLLFAWKRKFKGYDHAVFITYSLAFMSLLTVIITLGALAGLPTQVVVLSMLLIPSLHLYTQLRGAYGLSRFSAIWRLFVLCVFIVIVLGLFIPLLILLGLMG